MIDQFYGTQQLLSVCLRAKSPMKLGKRVIEKDEPVLYFDNIIIAAVQSDNKPIMARGGWGNTPRVIWEDRAETTFSLTEGVMSSSGMAILMGAQMLNKSARDVMFVNRREDNLELDAQNRIFLSQTPSLNKPIFVYSYECGMIQDKQSFSVNENIITIENGQQDSKYLADYYFEYGEEALIYYIEKERFNGVFSLEAKFYSKDENEGIENTNILFMPKVRVVSNINLRLGERANPTTSVFNIVAMPDITENGRNVIMEIQRLNSDIDADI